jgi:hypothetical protein
MTTALHRSLIALGVGLAALVATLAVGVSDALALPSFPYPYALKSSWDSVNVATVVTVIVAVTVLQSVVVVIALRRRQQVAPALAEVTPGTGAGDTGTSEETRKAA